MRFEICYQCDEAQYDFNKVNPEVIYCFDEKALKIWLKWLRLYLVK